MKTVLAAVHQALSDAGLDPTTDARLVPERILLMGGRVAGHGLLAVHIDDGDLVLENLCPCRGKTNFKRFPLASPNSLRLLVGEAKGTL
jgi:hypothetical protein